MVEDINIKSHNNKTQQIINVYHYCSILKRKRVLIREAENKQMAQGGHLVMKMHQKVKVEKEFLEVKINHMIYQSLPEFQKKLHY